MADGGGDELVSGCHGSPGVMAAFRSSPLLPVAKKALGAGESNIISVTQSQLFMRFNGVDDIQMGEQKPERVLVIILNNSEYWEQCWSSSEDLL
ncbi:hypothetical protein BJX68DRAFT_269130 [Aspergillus pseudodeflectus]|uniref:Uncharacterized protein n=1 Tax=Aspergillus pseudodeflectus TaxID=176178 RepID=A0ABR4JZW5_9EURO